MSGWDAAPSGDWEAITGGADWNATSSGQWNSGEANDNKINWADDAAAEDSHNDFDQDSYQEAVEAPAEPVADENGRSSGVIKVSLPSLFLDLRDFDMVVS